MAKYLLVYHGGGMPEGEEAQAKVMAAWGTWFQNLGPALADGGNPISADQDHRQRRVSFGRRWRKPGDRLQPDRGRRHRRGRRAGQGMPGARRRRKHRGRGNLQRDVVDVGPGLRFDQQGRPRPRPAGAERGRVPVMQSTAGTGDNRASMSEEEVPAGPPAWPGGGRFERPMGRHRVDVAAPDARMVAAAVLRLRAAAATEADITARPCSGSVVVIFVFAASAAATAVIATRGIGGSGNTAGVEAAVVDIDTSLGGGAAAAGTGIVLTSSGVVLTNNHVVAGGQAISVRLTSTGATYPATS